MDPLLVNKEAVMSAFGVTRCLELALEGENRCNTGDFKNGVEYLERAIDEKTDNLQVLSSIYSQLGNAYFHLEDYGKALEYHRLDRTLARAIEDRRGEAKAMGNMGNTLKQLEHYDMAIQCCKQMLTIAQQIDDKVIEGRAQYSLGNIYYFKGKSSAELLCKEQLPSSIAPLKPNDNGGQLLQQTSSSATNPPSSTTSNSNHQAVPPTPSPEQTLPPTVRDNLYSSIKHFQLALELAEELNQRADIAASYYQLGNTHTLLNDHSKACSYHVRHLVIARSLGDTVGVCRGAWSLSNAYRAVGNYRKAAYFIMVHMYLSKKIRDIGGESMAAGSLAELLEQDNGFTDLSMADGSDDPAPDVSLDELIADTRRPSSATVLDEDSPRRRRRLSMNNLDDIDKSPSGSNKSVPGGGAGGTKGKKSSSLHNEEPLLDHIYRLANRRINEQRCDISTIDKENRPNRQPDLLEPRIGEHATPDDFLELLAGIQGRRMNDQRAELPELPGLQDPERVLAPHIDKLRRDSLTSQLSNNGSVGRGGSGSGNNGAVVEERLPAGETASADGVKQKEEDLNEDFIDMLIKCQSARIDGQRSELPSESSAVTVPQEDFISNIIKHQQRRFDEQRAVLSPSKSIGVIIQPSSSSSSTNNHHNSTSSFNNSSGYIVASSSSMKHQSSSEQRSLQPEHSLIATSRRTTTTTTDHHHQTDSNNKKIHSSDNNFRMPQPPPPPPPSGASGEKVPAAPSSSSSAGGGGGTFKQPHKRTASQKIKKR